jgi:hypothetical protein
MSSVLEGLFARLWCHSSNTCLRDGPERHTRGHFTTADGGEREMIIPVILPVSDGDLGALH